MKTKKMFSKVLAAALAVLMLVGLMPVFASAADVGSIAAADDDNNGLNIGKTATLEDDGTYTIDLEAYVTGTVTVTNTTTSKPTDIVLVLDVSGSMYYAFSDSTVTPNTEKGAIKGYYTYLYGGSYYPVWFNGSSWQWRKATSGDSNWTTLSSTGNIYISRMGALMDAVEKFVTDTANSNVGVDVEKQHRISIVTFAEGAQTVRGLTYVDSTGKDELMDCVYSLFAGGDTDAAAGMTQAQSILSDSGDRAKAALLFTDGVPTDSGSKFSFEIAAGAITAAGALKNSGTSVFAVSVMSNADPNVANEYEFAYKAYQGTALDEADLMNSYMNAVSSNFPSATATGTGTNYPMSGQAWSFNLKLGSGATSNGYYKKAANASELSNIFGEIQSTIISGSAKYDLNANAVLKDIMNTGFSLEKATATAEVYNYNFNAKGFNATASATLTPSIDKTVGTVSVTGFDYAKHFVPLGQSNDNPNGGKMVKVTISGIIPTDEAVTNSVIDTNNALSGMYAKAVDAEPVEAFVQPKTILTSYAYVVDYAKSFNISSADWKMNTVQHYATAMDKITSANTNVPFMKYGTFNGTTYTPNTMQWNGYDSFYVFGESTDSTVTGASANANGNLWSKVTVMPANNVYYEDTFVTTSEENANGGAGIYYGGTWSEVKESTNNTNTETPSNAIHGGWINGDAGLSNDTGYSDGSAHYSKEATATAKFSFTGTGFDIYSRTNGTTGTVLVQVTKDGTSQYLIVNCLAVSGDYYQIPTVWFSGDYGTYDVEITVTGAAGEGRLDYYLDGIKIYNPMDPSKADSTVSGAYGEELNATFRSVREILITANDLNSIDSTAVNGAVFIDKNEDGEVGATSSVVADYEDYGPKNEVYLAEGQGIVFNVGSGKKVQVGLKAPAGSTTALVSWQNGTAQGSVSVNHSTDLFYEVTPDANGNVVIKNGGSNLLSVTKVKLIPIVSGTDASIATASVDTLLLAADEFDTMPVVAYSLRAEEPAEPEEPTEPETPTESTGPNVEIENPEEPAEPEQPDVKAIQEQIRQFVTSLFNAFRGWFGRP